MLELDGLTTTYGDLTAVDDVSVTVEDGELFCLLGPSGCGKSTILRTVAGFEAPASGRIRIDGTDVTDRPPYERNCSIVFQDWALFPNKTVVENVAFGLKMEGVTGDERRERARETLELVEIAGYADAMPAELSGGQKQRVALARSLTVDPDLLLLDEPLSNLDRRLREAVQLEIKEIHDRLGTTMVYVTHDQDEAFTLADRLGVMDDGRLTQVGAPATVYEDPANRFVEGFLGSTNFLPCRVAAADERPPLDTPLGVQVRAPIDGADLEPGAEVVASLRPERLETDPTVEADAAGPAGTAAVEDGGVTGGVTVPGTVTERIHRGSDVRLRLSVGDAEVVVAEPVGTGLDLAAGDAVGLRWRPDEAVYFDAAGERCR